MSDFSVFFIVFACGSGSLAVGSYVRNVLPEDQLNEDSALAVGVATGLIATMAALIPGLLISSARASFDTVSTELIDTAGHVVGLDRVLAKYGPETQPIREEFRRSYQQAQRGRRDLAISAQARAVSCLTISGVDKTAIS